MRPLTAVFVCGMLVGTSLTAVFQSKERALAAAAQRYYAMLGEWTAYHCVTGDTQFCGMTIEQADQAAAQLAAAGGMQ